MPRRLRRPIPLDSFFAVSRKPRSRPTRPKHCRRPPATPSASRRRSSPSSRRAASSATVAAGPRAGFASIRARPCSRAATAAPAVVPGKSADSLLIALVQGVDPDNVMPRKGSRLTPEQIGLLRAWIDQGALWDAGVTFGRVEPANLKPRLPAVPAAAKDPNPMDRFLEPYFAAHHIKPAQARERSRVCPARLPGRDRAAAAAGGIGGIRRRRARGQAGAAGRSGCSRTIAITPRIG